MTRGLCEQVSKLSYFVEGVESAEYRVGLRHFWTQCKKKKGTYYLCVAMK
jgi:hypothetical protein